MPELVSVIIPTYNESLRLSCAIESVLCQTHGSIEVIICDNSSNDDTLEIARSYQLRDSRIQVVSRERNIGGPANLCDGVQRARGKYFVFCGGHDLMSSNYVEELLNCLSHNQSAVLAMGKTCWLDNNGKKVAKQSSLLCTSGLSQLGTYVSLMFQNQHYLYGMMDRRAFLSCIHTKPPITPGSGELVLQELAAKGEFIVSTVAIWHRVIPRDKESPGMRLFRYKSALNQSKTHALVFCVFPMLQYSLLYLLLPFRLFSPLSAIKVFVITLPIILFKVPYLAAGDLLFFAYMLRRRPQKP